MDPQNIFQPTEELPQDYQGTMAQIRENSRNYARQRNRLRTQELETLTRIRNDTSIPTMIARLKKVNELHDQTNAELTKVSHMIQDKSNSMRIFNFLRSSDLRESLPRSTTHVPNLEFNQLEGQQQENIDNLRALTLETEQLEETLHKALTEPGNDLELD